MADRFMQEGKSSYWRFCRWLVLICLVAWLVATLVPLTLAQLGMTGSVLGWPFVFALAAFVVPLVYLIIIGLYSLVMDRAERDECDECGGRVSERTTDE